jgi:hypothetical protein
MHDVNQSRTKGRPTNTRLYQLQCAWAVQSPPTE